MRLIWENMNLKASVNDEELIMIESKVSSQRILITEDLMEEILLAFGEIIGDDEDDEN